MKLQIHFLVYYISLCFSFGHPSFITISEHFGVPTLIRQNDSIANRSAKAKVGAAVNHYFDHQIYQFAGNQRKNIRIKDARHEMPRT